jgi:tetratricopeptide (TPR) repeat protein
MNKSRSIRIFLSSTFRDFGEERDLLVRKVFPALRARLKERFVELVDVDLRWGITVEEAERGEVLPICLAEIDRSRPYFIGMLGERYGWIPPQEVYAPELLEREPWLKKHQGGKSVTELEILHGVFKNKRMKTRAFFYFRSPAYARSKGGHYVHDSTEDRQRQLDLKRRIKDGGYSVTGYRDPEALAKRMERDLWKLLDTEFPASDIPDAFERESMRHEAYAAPRRRLYLGGERYQVALEKEIQSEVQKIVIEGESGGGKSSLISNFFEAYRKRHPRHLVHEHYLGASADASDPHSMVRRVIEFLKLVTKSREEIAYEPQELMSSLPMWLASASGFASKRKTRFIFVLDALNNLTDQQDLRWLPTFLPKGITVVVSCLPGVVLDSLKGKTAKLPWAENNPKWKIIKVFPLTKSQGIRLLKTYLAGFNKKLSPPMVQQVRAHSLATNPLFIRTLAEELRLFGVHEELQKRLDQYLTVKTIDGLIEQVLERVEIDCGKKQFKSVVTTIWASRSGLTEKEIIGLAKITPVTWAFIRSSLDEALQDTGGKITIVHDYVRSAIKNRYLPTAQHQAKAHASLGSWFRTRTLNDGRVYEEPWQWLMAQRWTDLVGWLDSRQVLLSLTSEDLRREWLGYWIKVSATRNVDLTLHYSKAWSRLIKGLDKSETLTLTSSMQQALETAGYLNSFVERLARVALKLSREIWSEKHSNTFIGVRNLAQLLGVRQNTGDLKEAIALLRGLVHIQKITKSNDVATTLNLLGVSLASVNSYDEAEVVYKEALGLFSLIDGNENPESTASVLNNLGELENGRGQPDQAKEWLMQCLRIRKRTLPPDHPLLATTMDNLAKTLAAQGLIYQSNSLFEQALEMRTRILGGDHPETNNTRVNWGTVLFNEKKYSKSFQLFRKAWQADLLRFGPEHFYTIADALTCLACYREEASLFAQKGIHKSALKSLKAAHVLACRIVQDSKKSSEDVKEQVVRSMKKLSLQATKSGEIALANAFHDLADSLATSSFVQ